MLSESVLASDTDPVEKGIDAGITERLNIAIPKGDGADIARRSGVSYNSLLKYLSGRQPRPSTLLMLARSAGVSLEWLISGEGHMRPPPPLAAPPPPPEKPFRLFGNVKIDRLVDAYEGALASAHGDRRLTMHLTVLLYDKLAELAENKA